MNESVPFSDCCLSSGSLLRRWTKSVLALAAGLWMTNSQAQTVDTVLTNRLAEPYNVVIEGGTYFISDSGNDRIIRFVPDSGAFSTLAGFAGRPGSTDGKGVFARFFSPRGLVSVPARNGLVVSDYANHTLRLVKLDGTVTTLVGTPGQAGFDATHFNFPSALATDTNGNVYISDTKNNAIRKLDLAGNLSTVATGFSEPDGIAVGDNGDLWIADSRNYTIKRRRANGTVELIAGIPGQAGALDSIFSNETLFNNPSALLWLGGASGLLVSDSGNHALRRIYFDPEIGGYSVETYAGSPTQPGFVNGPVRTAKFKLPTGLIKDPVGGFVIADLGNNSLRRIQTSTPLPPVSDPVVGYVIFQKDAFGELLSKLIPVTQAVFNNDVVIAVLPESATETYFTYGATPPSSLEDNIPSPNRLIGNSPPIYRDGVHPDEVPPSIFPAQPDVTVKVIGTQDGRRPSSVVQARFQFKTANPSILGDNAASFVITNVTANAEMWYTVDGSDPSVNGPTSKQISIGVNSLKRSASPILFKVRAFRTDYKSSEIVSKTFLPEDFQANRISFGFESGEASSDFTASPGQTFYAPVTLSLLPSQAMYTLQFNMTVTNLNSSPPVTPGAVGFESMLEEHLDNEIYRTIPPSFFLNGKSVPPELRSDPRFADLVTTNSAVNLLAVGWLERRGQTNLYDTTKQDLITYSIAHDTVFLSAGQKVVVGGYNFKVPDTAVAGNTYQIQVARPSATADGISQDNYIEAPLDGTLTATPTNLVNSIKIVTVAQRRYIVGDVAPFRWFNAGDFGEGLLLNNDVVQVFQSAVMLFNRPPDDSDFFDAMDSSDGSTNGVFFGSDLAINDIRLGDGVLNVDDIYVTFRRALDPTLTWYARYWEGGTRQATPVPNVFRASPSQAGERLTLRSSDLPAESFIAGPPSAIFQIDDVLVQPGQVVQVPVRARITGSYPLRVLMLNVEAEALDGSPAIEGGLEFVPVPALGNPTLTASLSAHSFAGAWLDSKVVGVAGNAIVGYFQVKIPSTATPSSAYRLHFGHASGSPNGLGLFPKAVQDGLLTLQDRSASSLSDGIPDSWRLRSFGAVTSPIAAASTDADGDGVSNLAEFKAGTDPMSVNSHFHLAANRSSSPFTLRWPSSLNRSYAVESASSLSGGKWTTVGPVIPGTGQEIQFTPDAAGSSTLFFRVRLTD